MSSLLYNVGDTIDLGYGLSADVIDVSNNGSKYFLKVSNGFTDWFTKKSILSKSYKASVWNGAKTVDEEGYEYEVKSYYKRICTCTKRKDDYLEEVKIPLEEFMYLDKKNIPFVVGEVYLINKVPLKVVNVDMGENSRGIKILYVEVCYERFGTTTVLSVALRFLRSDYKFKLNINSAYELFGFWNNAYYTPDDYVVFGLEKCKFPECLSKYEGYVKPDKSKLPPRLGYKSDLYISIIKSYKNLISKNTLDLGDKFYYEHDWYTVVAIASDTGDYVVRDSLHGHIHEISKVCVSNYMESYRYIVESI